MDRIISLGMGKQSSAMYLMSSMGVIDHADFAVFADTGAEHPETLKYAAWLIDWSKKNSDIPIYTANHKSIMTDILKGENSTGQKFASIPAFTEGGGMVRRQCTMEYKIGQVNKKVREVLGIKKNHRLTPVEYWIGITREEAIRMKPSRDFNITNIYPVIEYRRGELVQWMQDQGFPIPVKSSCTFCPYQSNARWNNTKTDFPEDFEQACQVDRSIRDASKRGSSDKLFLHKSLVPLQDIDFNDNQMDMFGNECEGHCGL